MSASLGLLLLLPVLLLVGVYAAIPYAFLQLRARRLLAACRREHLVAITFDDGPGSELTPLILDRLAAAGVPATFFVLGQAVVGHEDLVRSLADRGHQVGCHGHAHVRHLGCAPWRTVADTRTAIVLLRRLLRRRGGGMVFRPPYGRLNLVSLAWLLRRRVPVAPWTHDGYDTRLGADVPLQRTVDELRASGGGIVLLHDFDRRVPNPGARVIERLDAILALRREGFRFVRIDEVLRLAAVPRRERRRARPAPALSPEPPPAPPSASPPGAIELQP